MVISLLTFKTVLLLSVWVLISAFFAGFLSIPLLLLCALTLMFVHRHFLELQTVRVMAWIIAAFVCVSFFSAGVRMLTTIDIFESTPWLGASLRSPSTYWFELFLGTVAGLKWPKALFPSFQLLQTRREFSIAANIVVIAPFAFISGFLLTLNGIWPLWIPLALEWFPVLSVVWYFGSVASALLVVVLLAAISVEWPGFTAQTRRVVLGGLSAIAVTTILQVPLRELADVVVQLAQQSVYFSQPRVTAGTVILIWVSSAKVVSGLGLILGIWAGLRWPYRLLLPARLSEGTPRVRFAKNVAAVVVYLILALLAHVTISLWMTFLVWD